MIILIVCIIIICVCWFQKQSSRGVPKTFAPRSLRNYQRSLEEYICKIVDFQFAILLKTNSFTGSFQGFVDLQEKHYKWTPHNACFRCFWYAILIQNSWWKRYSTALLVSILYPPIFVILYKTQQRQTLWMTHTHKNLKKVLNYLIRLNIRWLQT